MLFFYPSAWSFVCPTEILAFDARSSEFSSRQCAVVFISTDSEHVLKAWNSFEREEGGLGGVNIPLVADRSHRISRDYGVLIEEDGVAQRATVIIDPTGTIRAVTICDANIGRSVDELKRMLEALQFTDEYGEGCPSGWKTGDQGIKLSSSPEEEVVSPLTNGIPPNSSVRPQYLESGQKLL
jgi:peroxiredoxin 2/4